jgi:hypothetical protein
MQSSSSTSLLSEMLPEAIKRAHRLEQFIDAGHPYEQAKNALERLESFWGTLHVTAQQAAVSFFPHEPQIRQLESSLARSRSRIEALAPKEPWWRRLLSPVLTLLSTVAAFFGFAKASKVLAAGAAVARAALPAASPPPQLQPAQWERVNYRRR